MLQFADISEVVVFELTFTASCRFQQETASPLKNVTNLPIDQHEIVPSWLPGEVLLQLFTDEPQKNILMSQILFG